MLGQFGCPVARTDFVTLIRVGEPEAKPARAIAKGGGDVVVSEYLVRRHDGRDVVWIVEAQRGHVRDRMTQAAERCRLLRSRTPRRYLCLADVRSGLRHGCAVTSAASRRDETAPQADSRPTPPKRPLPPVMRIVAGAEVRMPRLVFGEINAGAHSRQGSYTCGGLIRIRRLPGLCTTLASCSSTVLTAA